MNFRTDEGARPRAAGQRRRLPARAARGGRRERRDRQPARRERRPHQAARAGAGVLDGDGSPLELWDRSARTTSRPRRSSASPSSPSVAGAGVHAVHVTNAGSLAAAARRPRPSSAISIETCPHYLTLGTDSDVGTHGKVNPPLRPPGRSRGAVGGDRRRSTSTRSAPTTSRAPAASRTAAGQGLGRLPGTAAAAAARAHRGAPAARHRRSSASSTWSRRARRRRSGSATARARSGPAPTPTSWWWTSRRHAIERRTRARRRRLHALGGRAPGGARRATRCCAGSSATRRTAASSGEPRGRYLAAPAQRRPRAGGRPRMTATSPGPASSAPTTSERYERAGFGRPVGVRRAARAAGHRRAVPHDRRQPEAVLRVAGGLHDVLRRGGLGGAPAHRAARGDLPGSSTCRSSTRTSRRSSPWTAATLGAKVPAIMDVPERGYLFPDEIAPQPGDLLLPKKHPSAFFGTPLASYLIGLGVDTLVVTGSTTSGCVRGTRRRRVLLQLPLSSCRTTRSTTARRPCTRSTCSTWRRSTRT